MLSFISCIFYRFLLKSPTSTGYFSNSTGLSVTNRRFFPSSASDCLRTQSQMRWKHRCRMESWRSQSRNWRTQSQSQSQTSTSRLRTFKVWYLNSDYQLQIRYASVLWNWIVELDQIDKDQFLSVARFRSWTGSDQEFGSVKNGSEFHNPRFT